ncbi:H-NS histone family protein [Paraburkholderia acidisoli]|uniref:H-NS histone family protein n=1 Tax=Paraburkholderia acidisoli TaxID=2571748 RepID=A0A7Z2GN60_9BURK|nr:H-NS family nucleoid-associated regulatory protein [Paraburkholderia acidisoli]QGZ64783.1 H-NS histone family protein [Paraburkholderia acidisoli]
MATLESIQAKIAKLQAQAEALAVTKSSAVLEKIRDLMHKHGVTLGDIESHAGKRRGRKPGSAAAAKSTGAVAKYRDPKSGATWSGHGRAPGWIASAKDRSKFLVDGGVKSAAPAKKASAAAGNYVRGPQPALYRDPKSGATWSGRGPAPAWLAGAKDRTKFLIAKADGAAATAGAKVAKATKPAAPAKKAAAKKAAVKTAAKTAPKTAAVKEPVAKKAVAKKAVAEKAVAKKAVVKKTVAKKAVAKPAAEQAAPQKAAKKVVARKGPAVKKTPASAPASVAPAAAPAAAPAVVNTPETTPAA